MKKEAVWQRECDERAEVRANLDVLCKAAAATSHFTAGAEKKSLEAGVAVKITETIVKLKTP